MQRLTPAALEAVNLYALAAPMNSPEQASSRSARERRRQRERWRQGRDARLTAFRIKHGLPDTLSAKDVTALLRAERACAGVA